MDLPLINEKIFEQIFLKKIPMLDVRSEKEFKQGSFPNTTNLPILNNEHREKVGTCYKKCGRDCAVELGRLLTQGATKDYIVSKWVQFVRDNPQAVLFCFRGGMRSKIAQTWIKEAGLVIPRIEGGQKALRRFLIKHLNELEFFSSFMLLSGKTGVGKTQLLSRATLKHFSCNLEEMANHRGSAFGGMLDAPASQIDFENRLAIRFLTLKNNNISSLLMEKESKNIGPVHLPAKLLHKMKDAPIILLQEELGQRIAHLIDLYIRTPLLELTQNGQNYSSALEILVEQINFNLKKLAKRLGSKNIAECQNVLRLAHKNMLREHSEKYFIELIEKLLFYYYDPLYSRQESKNRNKIIFQGNKKEVQEFLTAKLRLSSRSFEVKFPLSQVGPL